MVRFISEIQTDQIQLMAVSQLICSFLLISTFDLSCICDVASQQSVSFYFLKNPYCVEIHYSSTVVANKG